jgi:hypothetical protein
MRTGNLFAVLAGTALLCSGAPASAATLRVDDDHAQCPKAAFTTVQQGIDAAAPFDVILVCAGVYDHARIDPGRDHLTLRAQGAASFQRDWESPAPAPNAFVWDQAIGTRIEGFHFGEPTRYDAVNAPHPCRLEGLPAPAVLDGTNTVFRGNEIENWLFWSSDIVDEDGELLGTDFGYCSQDPYPSVAAGGSASILRNHLDYTGSTGAVKVTGVATIRDNTIVSSVMDEDSGLGPNFNDSVIDVLGTAVIQRNLVQGPPHPYIGHAGVAINIRGGAGSIVGAQNGSVDGMGNTVVTGLPENPWAAIGIRVAAPRTRVGDNTVGELDNYGILAETGSDTSRFFGNEVHDAFPPCGDRTTGNRTAGTANTWTDNVADAPTSEPPEICPEG